MLAAYVSGHGFGHATRTAEVLGALRARAPGLRIVVTTSAPAFLFEDVIAPPLELRARVVDVGLVQQGALVIDEAGTAEACRRFDVGWQDRVAEEARWLAASGARLVVADIPPLAFAAAAAAGVPSIGLGNFCWDWIYRHLAERQPALAAAAARAAGAYASAERLLRLPLHGDMTAFPAIEDVPLVARRPIVPKADARRRLGLDARPCVLLSFGGIGLPGLGLDALGSLGRFQFVVTGAAVERHPPNVRTLANAALTAAGLGYPDLVGAADVVVTKPGYGIVTDCIGAGTRLVYTDRGDFPEYPVLVAQMPRYLPAVHVSNEDLHAGRLAAALAEATQLAWPEPPRLDGAAVAAERLAARL